MRNLLIIGARGYGREIYNMFLTCKESLGDVECIGFLDDKKSALDGFDGYPPIISSVEDYIPKENDVFICALGEPKWIRYYTQIIEEKEGKFISLINPHAFIGKNTIIGDGCIVPGWVSISNDINIGNHTSIGIFSNIGHDVIIGNCCHLGAYTFIGGRTFIGNEVTVHPRVNILPDKKIGNHSVLGAGSVVIRNVKEGETVFGMPAKKIN